MKQKYSMFIVSIALAVMLTGTVFASYGIGYPVPRNIELTKGESTRFYFTVDTNLHNFNVSCTYPLDNKTSLAVVFDQETTVASQQASTRVYGSITAPAEISLGPYKETFCVECSDIVEEERTGAVTKGRHCGIPIQVEIVEKRTKVNEYVPEKPVRITWFSQIDKLGLIILVITILAFLYYEYKKRKGSKVESKPGKEAKQQKIGLAKPKVKKSSKKKSSPKKKASKPKKKASKKSKKATKKTSKK